MNPTHAYINDTGDIECIFPSGYPINSTHELPKDFFSRGWYIWDNGFKDDLENWKKSKIKEANELRNIKLYNGCNTPKGTIDSNLKSRQLLASIQLEALSNPLYTVKITLQNNTMVFCNVTEIISISSAIRAHDQSTHEECVAFKNIILKATTIRTDL